MKKLLILLLALLAIAAIAYFCVYKTRVPAIQADIESRARAALAENGIKGVNVSVNGRDIILEGEVGSQRIKESLDRIAGIEGYNFVDNRVNVGDVPGSEAFIVKAPQSHSLTINLNDQREIIMDGILDAESHKAVKAAAIARYGEDKVKDRVLDLDLTQLEGMPDIAVQIVDNISGLSEAKVVLQGRNVRVEGASPSQLLLEQIGKKVALVSKGYTLDLGLEVSNGVAGQEIADGAGKADEQTGGKPAYSANGGKKVIATKAERRKCQREFNRILKNRVVFNSSSATFQSSSYNTLNRLAKAAKLCSNIKISVAGHTDSTGRNSVNKKLSKKRALSVVNYLVKQGVPRENLVAVGYGSSKPVASNKTRSGRSRNRRIELTVESIK